MLHLLAARSKQLLLDGGVIAYPTEAVYGLGCDPDNEAAVSRILDIKQRPWHKGLSWSPVTIGSCNPIWTSLN